MKGATAYMIIFLWVELLSLFAGIIVCLIIIAVLLVRLVSFIARKTRGGVSGGNSNAVGAWRHKLKRVFVSFCGLFLCLVTTDIVYKNFFYVREMNQIKDELNKLENVEVVNIWGHEDITLEEISARLRIRGKGEIVLCNLNANDFTYPNRVPINEIGGYSFTVFYWNGGIGPGIDIGTNGNLGGLIGKEFNTVKDVLDNYDLIYETVKGLKMPPEINHFEAEDYEFYLLVHNEKSTDKDPIFNLIGIYGLAEYAGTLKWNRDDSYYNKQKN